MERIVKGIWIPLEIWQTTDLNWNEKILLMEIDSFTSAGKECYFSNEYICNLLNVKDRQARQYLYHLIDSGYVEVVRFDGRKRYIQSAKKCQADWQKTAMQGGNFSPHTDINDLNINNPSSIRRTAFQKPTLDEVRAYCAERGNKVDPEAFFDFYESKGWMVGKSHMKDWKASVRTWEKREKEVAPRKREKRRETVFEHNLRAIDQVMGTNMHGQFYGGMNDDQ